MTEDQQKEWLAIELTKTLQRAYSLPKIARLLDAIFAFADVPRVTNVTVADADKLIASTEPEKRQALFQFARKTIRQTNSLLARYEEVHNENN